VTLGRTIFAKSRHLNAATIRHEGQHARDWGDKGIWWMLTHPTDREKRARAVEGKEYPKVVEIP
jgi:hypothetical protein